MRGNKKGFTLIELLAVIVILAIIALIATPIVLNLIDIAKKGAAVRSAEGIRDAARKAYYSALVQDTNSWNEDKTVRYGEDGVPDSDIIEIDGQSPKGGTVTISATGIVTGRNLKYAPYYCRFENTGTAICEKNEVTDDDNNDDENNSDNPQGNVTGIPVTATTPLEIGDIISIKGERFIVINDSDVNTTTVVAFAEKNIDTRIDSDMYNKQNDRISDSSKLNVPYCSSETNYSALYDNSLIKPKIDAYVQSLSQNATGRLLSHTKLNGDATDLEIIMNKYGSSISNNVIANAPQWLVYEMKDEQGMSYGGQNYWVQLYNGFLGNEDMSGNINQYLRLGQSTCSIGDGYGIRPVITIPKNEVLCESGSCKSE